MNIEKLFLKRDDIKLTRFKDEYATIVPAHPSLFRNGIKYDPDLASQVFPKAAKAWHRGLRNEIAKIDDIRYRVYLEKLLLSEELIVKKDGTRRWQIKPADFLHPKYHITDNGFAYGFDLGDYPNGQLILRPQDEISINSKEVNFTSEKLRAYSADNIDSKYFINGYAYVPHNIGSIPAGLLLIHWVTAYHNEALKVAGAFDEARTLNLYKP